LPHDGLLKQPNTSHYVIQYDTIKRTSDRLSLHLTLSTHLFQILPRMFVTLLRTARHWSIS